MPDVLLPYAFYAAVGLIGIVFIIAAIAAGRASARRIEELQNFAMGAGLQLYPTTGFETPYTHSWLMDLIDPAADMMSNPILIQLRNFDPFGRGHSPVMRNMIGGQKDGLGWCMFDYAFTEGSGRDETTYHYAVVAARTGIIFPHIVLKPENFLLKLGEHLGLKDIHFEVDEFNQRYHVWSDDDKAAYDVLCPQTIDFLLDLPTRWWQFFGNFVLIVQPGTLTAAFCYEVMNEMEGFISKVPAYVQEDSGLSAQ